MMNHTTTYDTGAGAATAGQDALLLAARVLLGAIFVQSGFGKLMALGGFIAGMESQGVPMAAIVAPLGALVEAFGGLAIVLGAWTRLAALLVAAFTVAATLIAHRYWEAAPDAMKMQQIQFMKNLAIIGGFLSLVASGGGRFSIDGWRARR
ncbi:hypothetical protein TSH100_27330 [Azospirillum sp. TSH100]|uniref:DoxX family protein n=1 Tax=Azospirillum sp. TSH100 TaxID=652764 RepID=UPI000D60F284|nr:DoxX family protein [Azospirillum sp. TSH100]PWC81392.1 hypothetical protein TSH100_27330 [Azospirillum sp. TSH100]QCG91997.1 DoxX family protein [Azospirillum sp. TSH100]